MAQKINITGENVKIFRKDKTSQAGNAYTTYCMKISQKQQNSDEWISAFVDVKFKKGLPEVFNKAVINIKSCFPTLNKWNDKTTIQYMITDFDFVEKGEAPNTDPQDTSWMDNMDSIEEEIPFE